MSLHLISSLYRKEIEVTDEEDEEVRTLGDNANDLDGNEDLDGFIVSDGHLSEGEHNSDIEGAVMAGLAESEYVCSLSL